MDKEGLNGLLAGFGLAGVPGLLVSLVCWVWNPHFVDQPFSLWWWLVATPGLLGALVSFGLKLRVARRWPAILAVGALTLITGFSIPSGERLDGLRLVILGVDGATWAVIDPMLERGELPAFGAARAEGASGIMRAPEPIFSPLIWTTLATGLEPREHGIRGFSMESSAIKSPRYWNIAQSQGMSIGIYKWLVTWPPEALDEGFMVPAWLARSTAASPPQLSVVKELELSQRRRRQAVSSTRNLLALTPDLIKVGLRWSTLREACRWRLRMAYGEVDPRALDAGLQQLRVAIDWDVFAASLWSERPEVASFNLYATDALSHRFWRYHDPEHFDAVSADEGERYGEVVRDAYRQADEILGELRQMIGEETRLLVVSDHGFQALSSHGALRMLPRTEPVINWLGEHGLRAEVLRQGAKLRVLAGSGELTESLDAFVQAHRLMTGEAVYRVEGIPDDDAALGLAVIAEHLEPEALLLSGKELRTLLKPAEGFSGDHHPEGIVIATGPRVIPGANTNIDAIDFTPIVLAGLGIAQGEDMVGRVPDGLWPSAGVGPSWSRLRGEVEYVPTEELPGEETKQALRALGYLD
jgi:predicted AlkP superfamily phosphohydrolase/phosphomutase